jgi:hypothetical protein
MLAEDTVAVIGGNFHASIVDASRSPRNGASSLQTISAGSSELFMRTKRRLA